ncbi:expressed unknown protein [Seminavis robusta]|uniref:NAD(P)-binding domain-containing protein n=1 Tax=Seminavis robusta TaxID=568900 RepID=A0A9N8HRX0_9STRA|nr:expressed unknown protein [Seminavis robusta]|eukprot:Sro1449_g273640.1 n/a (267) ;mRNA; r:4845-5645
MSSTSTINTSTTTTLVVGATGATGKWVVKMLLDQGNHVKVIARSKDRMLSVLQELDSDDTKKTSTDHLTVTEASLLDLSDEEIQEQVKDCDAVVSCLGHTVDFKGLWGHPRKLVTEAVQRLTTAIAKSDNKKAKFLLMGSDGVSNPNGQDDPRTRGERTVLFLLRHLIPPHADNEAAAAYLHSSLGTSGGVEWCVVRPTDLINGPPTGDYTLYDKPPGGLFGAGVALRSNVAHAMVALITNPEKWAQYKFQMPSLYDNTKKAEETK